MNQNQIDVAEKRNNNNNKILRFIEIKSKTVSSPEKKYLSAPPGVLENP